MDFFLEKVTIWHLQAFALGLDERKGNCTFMWGVMTVNRQQV